MSFRRNTKLLWTMVRAGLTNRDLALSCGVDPSVISHWIRGQTNPTPQNMRSLMTALDVDTVEELGWTPIRTKTRQRFGRLA